MTSVSVPSMRIPLTLLSLVDRGAKLASGSIAFSELNRCNEVRSATYGQLYDDVVSCGNWLSARFQDMEQSTRVCLLGENSYAWVVAFFACISQGYDVIVLDPSLSYDILLTRLVTCDCSVIVYTSGQEEISDSLVEKTEVTKTLCLGSLADGNLAWRKDRLTSICQIPCERSTSGCSIWYSSGTYSGGHGVVVTQRNLLWDLTGVSKRIVFRREDIFLSVLPVCHLFEFMGSVLCSIWSLSQTVFCPYLLKYRTCCRLFTPTVMMVTPQLLLTLAGSMQGNGARGGTVLPDSMRLVISGGAPLIPHVVRSLQGLGLSVIQGYGATECSPVIAVGGRPLEDDYSVGIPLDSVKVDIKADGEIVVSGPTVARYLNADYSKLVDAKVSRSGVFYTGDFGHFDCKGRLYVDGRLDDVIVMPNGTKVCPSKVETLLGCIPGVEQVIVRNDTIESEVGCLTAYIKLAVDIIDNQRISDDVLDHLRQAIRNVNYSLNIQEQVSRVRVVNDSLSFGPLGKPIRRGRLPDAVVSFMV